MLPGIRAGHGKFRSGEQIRQESKITSSIKNYSIFSDLGMGERYATVFSQGFLLFAHKKM